jgi:protein-disulfide isomerase
VAAAIASQGTQQAPSNFAATSAAPIDAADHVKGDASSTVSVIEYGDFECPACGAWEPIMEQIESDYGNRVTFVFRNFPLTQIHVNALTAAKAAEAAGLQGKYWEMHDLLYQKQNDWVNDAASDVVSKHFNGYAQSLGLDVTKFDADISSDAVAARVQRDVDSGNAAQINHTPTFFVDLKQIQNPSSAQQFTQIIDQALAQASASSTATSTTQ